MKRVKIIVLFTCYNRKEKTISAIKKINNSCLNVEFLIIDDKSTDGTVESINKLNQVKKKVIVSNGNLYYSRGMRMGMEYLLGKKKKYDYLLIINDDVDFYEGFLEKMIDFSLEKNGIVIGSTIDSNGKLSYGGIKYRNKFSSKFKRVGPEYIEECDTFNANCVLIPYDSFEKCGAIDKHYTHSIGDFDYGFKLKKCGYKLYMLNEYVGLCNRNSIDNTWQDKSLNISERLRKKKQIKGLPFKQNFYYFYKNFNIFLAIKCSITPYIRILLKR